MDDWKCDNFAIVSNTVLKKLQMTRPGARIEIVSTKFGTGKNQIDSLGAMGTLTTYMVVAKVDESCETYHLVFKENIIKEGILRDIAKDAQFYPKEIGVYKELIPFINKFQKDVGVTPLPLAVPEFYGGTLSQDYSFLIMQNIGASGFKNAGRYLGYDEVLVCVTELAKINALGHALISENGQEHLLKLFPFLRDEIFVKHHFLYSFYLWSECYEHAIDMVRSVNYELGTKMGKYHNKSYDIACQQMARYDQHLQGLNHADLWFSNMMFKYNNNGAAIDVKFLDFQTIRLGSAATDLTYFLYTSTTRAFRNIYYREVLQAWLTSYKSTLTHIHMNISPTLTLDYLMQKMRETLPYAVVFMPFAMPLQLMDGGKDAQDKMLEVSVKNDHSIQVPEHWKDADQQMNEKSKSDQMNLAMNLAHIMYSSNNVKERMLEFYTEMSHFGVI